MNLQRLEEILSKFHEVRIAVTGDFFLDRYWRVAPELDEPSLETGLTAYQVVERRQSPGAAGTVTNNLAALGIGKIFAVGFVGHDGEGHELQQELDRIGVERSGLLATDDRATPCYTKPMRHGVEMNRFDIKNRTPTSPNVERRIIESIHQLADRVDAVMIMDQVSEENCGVITTAVREELIRMGKQREKPLFYADSRERLGCYTEMFLKGNDREIMETFGAYSGETPSLEQLKEYGFRLPERTRHPVFVTLGHQGQLVVDARNRFCEHVPAFAVEGPIDICGAGDATSSALVGSLCVGADACEAALIGNLAASVTIKKLGRTGTASPDELIAAWKSHQQA